jgi:hypothetical protein
MMPEHEATIVWEAVSIGAIFFEIDFRAENIAGM